MDAVPVAVAAVVGVTPVNVTANVVLYPVPGFEMSTRVTTPPTTVAVATALLPPPADRSTVGTEPYPEPPLVTATDSNTPGVDAQVVQAVPAVAPARGLASSAAHGVGEVAAAAQ